VAGHGVVSVGLVFLSGKAGREESQAARGVAARGNLARGISI